MEADGTRSTTEVAPPPDHPRAGLALAGVFALAVAVRLVVVLWLRPECTEGMLGLTYADQCFKLGGDVLYFRVQAEQLAAGEWFVNLLGRPAAQHPPAFTVLLAILYKLGLTSVQAQRIIMAFVGGLGAVLIARVPWRMVGPSGWGPGLVAGLVAAGYPVLWLNDITMFSESLLIPVVAATMLAWYRFLERPRLRRAVAVGALIGVTVLIRAECLLVAAPFGLMVLRLGAPWRRRLTLAAVAGAACVAVFAPWVVFNLARFDGRVTFASTPWLTTRFTACDEVFYGQSLGYYSFGCGSDLTASTTREADLDAEARDRSIEYLRDHLGRWPVQMAASVARVTEVWRPLENAQIDAYGEGRGYAPVLAGLGWYYVLAGFSVVGAVAVRRRGVPLAPLLAWALPVLAAVLLGGAVARYRVPFDVAMVVLGALGFWHAVRGLPDQMAGSRLRGASPTSASPPHRDTMASCEPSDEAAATGSG